MRVTSQGDPATEITHFERMGLNGLCSKSLILNRGQAFRGREGISLLVHAYYHTLAHFLLFFLSFLLYFIYFSCSLVGLLCSLFLSSPLLMFSSFLCNAEGPFYTACHEGFFTILPLNHFCLGMGVLSDHPLVCQLPNHHHLPMLAVPHPITKQRVLFCLLAHRGIPIRIRVGILSHYPSWYAPSDSNSSFPLLGGMSSQQDISPKRV